MRSLFAAVAVFGLLACSDEPDLSLTNSTDVNQTDWTVTKISDGDTLWVENTAGERKKIRLIGIDTPETGKCGYTEATEFLSDLVLGKAVNLFEGASEDSDRYGRLLRYVEVAGSDAGELLLLQGLAIARYDSRDGYGPHPRESVYIDADEGSPNLCPDSAWGRD